jgi:hypothetical protein
MVLYRTLDPQLSRWWQVDPVVDGFESLTPYNSNMNNPVRYDDPDGDCPTCPPAEWEMNAVANGELGRGIVDSFVGTATSIYNIVTNPVETAKGLYNAVINPIETGMAIVNNTVNEFKASPERAAGKVLGDGIQTAIGIGVVKNVEAAMVIETVEDGASTVKGGLENAATRTQVDNLAIEMESRGYTITGGSN